MKLRQAIVALKNRFYPDFPDFPKRGLPWKALKLRLAGLALTSRAAGEGEAAPERARRPGSARGGGFRVTPTRNFRKFRVGVTRNPPPRADPGRRARSGAASPSPAARDVNARPARRNFNAFHGSPLFGKSGKSG